eukprot:6415695-Ditylum_brightwellii.AAC.1
MTTINSNIDLSNQCVKTNQVGLKVRGESTNDLMINLFNAYQVVSDSNFSWYIRAKRDKCNTGEGIKVEKLMPNMLNKYNILVQQGIWNAMSPEQEQI